MSIRTVQLASVATGIVLREQVVALLVLRRSAPRGSGVVTASPRHAVEVPGLWMPGRRCVESEGRRGGHPQALANLAGDRCRPCLRQGREIPTLPQPASPTAGESDRGTVAQPAAIAGNRYLTEASNYYEGDSCAAEVHRQAADLEEPHRAASSLPIVVTQSGSSITWTYPGNGCSLPGKVTGNTLALPFEGSAEACAPSTPATSGFPTPWRQFPPPWRDVCQVPWRMTAISSPDPVFRGNVMDEAITLTVVYVQHWESQRDEVDDITRTLVQTYHRTPRG